jgi:fructosamine-3-kinase
VKLPDDVARAVEAAIGSATRIVEVKPVGGGCVTPVARLRTDDGQLLLLKWGERGRFPDALFREEARSLDALRRTDALRVPAVLAQGQAWLLLEWLEPGPPAPDAWQRLGRALVEVHRVAADPYGWSHDNFIGPLPQPNRRSDDWPSFWREQRLRPQLERARAAGHFTSADDGAAFDRLFRDLDDLLAPAAEDGPSLLHGDLWSGNVHMTAAGDAALIDPSCYCGHREVDLAMAELFGGFGSGFLAAYQQAWPLRPGYVEGRRAVYQLYYLLVHVNLFGSGYTGSVRAALRGVARR